MEIKTHHATLSQAIREGAKLRPQGFEFYFDEVGGSCAMGAAIEAIYGEGDANIAETLADDLFPYAVSNETLSPCPACDRAGLDIEDTVLHLNDVHRWTREQIADWLETEEEKLGFVTVVDTQDAGTASGLPATVEQHGAVSAST